MAVKVIKIHQFSQSRESKNLKVGDGIEYQKDFLRLLNLSCEENVSSSYSFKTERVMLDARRLL